MHALETALPKASRRPVALATAELLAIAFMGGVALAANKTGLSLLLFPELAALSHDVLTRPRGKWASQPIRMVATPVLTGTAGLFVTRHAHYGAVPILVLVLASLAVIRLLRSSIGPAISAGVLPIALDERHWIYLVAVCIGLVALAAVSWIWRKWGFGTEALRADSATEPVDDALEARSHERFWLLHLLVFVLILAAAGQFTGLRFLLFPPLIVMAYEIFGHPEIPGWMRHPLLFPLLCFLTASTGLSACRHLHGPLGIIATVTISIILLRIFDVHMPPALAVGLLPFVMKAPDLWFPHLRGNRHHHPDRMAFKSRPSSAIRTIRRYRTRNVRCTGQSLRELLPLPIYRFRQSGRISPQKTIGPYQGCPAREAGLCPRFLSGQF